VAEIAERDRQLSLAHARGPEEHHVLGALDEDETRELDDLFARGTSGEVEVILVKRLDRGEVGHPREHLARPGAARLTLGDQ